MHAFEFNRIGPSFFGLSMLLGGRSHHGAQEFRRQLGSGNRVTSMEERTVYNRFQSSNMDDPTSETTRLLRAWADGDRRCAQCAGRDRPAQGARNRAAFLRRPERRRDRRGAGSLSGDGHARLEIRPILASGGTQQELAAPTGIQKKASADASFSVDFAPEGAKAVRKQAARTGPHSPPNFTTRREIP